MASIDILDKVRQLKLLAKSSNLNEATAAAAIADKLILKYRITEEELFQNDNSNKETPGEDGSILYETARTTLWKQSLAMYLSEHYGCALWNDTSYETGRKVSRFRLVGMKSDREIVSFMFAWLVLEIERLTKLNCKGLGHIQSNSYSLGAVQGIKEQLQKDKEEIKKEATISQSAALMRLDERYDQSMIMLYSLHKNLKKSEVQSHNRIHAGAYSKGVSAGRNIHLGKAMGGKKTSLLK